MLTSTKTSPLRHLVNILSDAVARIEEKYASANLEFPALDEPSNERDPACLLLSDPDVVPLSSVIVAAANQLIVSARHPMQAVVDMAQSVSNLWYILCTQETGADGFGRTAYYRCVPAIGM